MKRHTHIYIDIINEHTFLRGRRRTTKKGRGAGRKEREKTGEEKKRAFSSHSLPPSALTENKPGPQFCHRERRETHIHTYTQQISSREKEDDENEKRKS